MNQVLKRIVSVWLLTEDTSHCPNFDGISEGSRCGVGIDVADVVWSDLSIFHGILHGTAGPSSVLRRSC